MRSQFIFVFIGTLARTQALNNPKPNAYTQSRNLNLNTNASRNPFKKAPICPYRSPEGTLKDFHTDPFKELAKEPPKGNSGRNRPRPGAARHKEARTLLPSCTK